MATRLRPFARLTVLQRLAVAIVVTAVILVVGALEFDHLANQPRIDLTLSGALGGKMTKLEDWQGQSTVCATSRVYGKQEWTGQFVGVVSGSHVVLNLAVYPFQGPGHYVSHGVPDAATLATTPINQAFGTLDVHILLSSTPEGAADARRYGTEPEPSSRPQSVAELSKLAGLGKASVTLDPNLKTGAVDALLLNSRAPDAPPTHISGNFRCGALGKGSDADRQSVSPIRIRI